MTDTHRDELPADVEALIGIDQYPEQGEFPRRAGLHLDELQLRRERQCPLLGPRGGDGTDRRPDCATDDAVGVVPTSPLGAGTGPRSTSR